MSELEKANLERLVDAYGLEMVLYVLSDICIDKAEHIRLNWQDVKTANYWAKRSIKVTRTADAVR